MKTFTIIVAGLLLAGSVLAANVSVRGPADFPAYKIVGPNDPTPGNASFVRPGAKLPVRDDQMQVGDTWYDYQANGCTGKKIAIDEQGGVHVTWMDGYSSENAGTRQQKYNYYFDGAWLEEDGVQAPPGTRSGYGTIILTREEFQRAMIFCHATGIIQGDDPTTLVLIDFDIGFGAFENFLTPNYPENNVYWPIGVLSPGGIIHVVNNRSDAGMISYTGTEFNNGQPNFPDVPIEVSPTSLNTYNIAQSPYSERAAITWISSRTGIPAPVEWDGLLAYQINNDLWLAWTDDGFDWNFENPLNVTNVIPTDPTLEDTVAAMGDTLRPFTTHEIIFDANDMIHIVFEARGMWEMPVYDPEVNRPPIYGQTLDASLLFHWTEEDCTFSPVADGWFSQQVLDDSSNVVLWPQPGAWKSNVCQPSLAYAPNGDLFCLFNFYPYGDYNDYVDPLNQVVVGRCHGDVAVTVSEDNGATWFYPTMVTETSSPLAGVGEAMCEEYPTLAEKVDENLHILYILDHEAGSVVQDDNANNTLNEVFYVTFPVDEVRRDSIWNGPDFHINTPHNPDAVADRKDVLPAEFALTGAYPNPFNSSARIEFNVMTGQNIELGLFSTNGRKVADLYSGNALSGRHQVTLHGAELPAGVYIVKLTNGIEISTMKVAMVK